MEGYRKGLEKLFKPRLVLEKELVRLWSASSFEEVEGVLAGVHSLLKGKGIGPLLPLSRHLLPKAYLFFRCWQALQGGLASGR